MYQNEGNCRETGNTIKEIGDTAVRVPVRIPILEEPMNDTQSLWI